MNVKMAAIGLLMFFLQGDSERVNHQRIIALIEKLGGVINYQTNNPKIIVGIYLNRTKVSDQDLSQIKDLTSLKLLDLAETQIGDAGLANLKKLSGLTFLDLLHTRITSKGIGHLKELSIGL